MSVEFYKTAGMLGAAVVAFLGVGAQAVSQGTETAAPRVFSTTARAASTVPLRATVTVPGVRLRVYVHAGDVVQVDATTQVTNPYLKNRNVMVGRFLTANGVRVSRAMATNVTPAIHHLPVSSASSFVATKTGTLVLDHRVYAAASWARYCRACKLRVDYAEMYVTVLGHE